MSGGIGESWDAHLPAVVVAFGSSLAQTRFSVVVVEMNRPKILPSTPQRLSFIDKGHQPPDDVLRCWLSLLPLNTSRALTVLFG